jgi:NAD+ synthase (glutamine-hydrolysing)
VLADFHSIYSHGFIRGAVCLPHMRVADSVFNTKRTLALAQRGAGTYAVLALLELGVSEYSNKDLFHQDILLDATRMAVARIVEASVDLSTVLLIGAPLRFQGKLFNWAVVIYRGKILGIVPKTYLPNYREFYEKRWSKRGFRRFAESAWRLVCSERRGGDCVAG